MVNEGLGKVAGEAVGMVTWPLARVCMANGENIQRGPQLPFKSEYAQRNGVGCGRRQRLGEKVNARLSQVA